MPEQEKQGQKQEEKEKPLGYINFDGLTGENNEVEIRIPGDRLNAFRRGQYVMLESGATGVSTQYLARIIRGPFYVPDAVGKDSAYARASILQADTVKFRPDFHGVCTAEILGQIEDEQSLAVIGTATRPFPQAAVRKLPGEEIEKLLTLGGDIFLGELSGYPEVKVQFRNDDKRILPRNLGIFGTVGAGKTNTSQVLIEGAAACGWAVIVLDVEGEYVEMDKPNNEAATKQAMKKLLERFGVEPAGLQRLKVMHCMNTEPSRKDSREFGLRFSNSDPYILSEILGFSDAQMERFLEVYYEQLEQQSHQSKEGSPKRQQQKKVRPGMAAFLVDADDTDDADEAETIIGVSLQEFVNAVKAKVTGPLVQGRSSWQVLLRKLEKLQRYDIFDKKDSQGNSNDLGDYSELFHSGQVTVFDVSNSSNVWINNIVISDLLRGLFRAKLKDRNEKLPPVMVVIEEAHSFVSRENVSRMDATLDTLRDISRRGRKRWISLCFISQQPAHLPPEIYELCNTKIVHQTTGSKNLDALKNSAGDVNPAIWQEIPVLGQGRCLVIGAQFRHPVLCDVRPCSSNRRFTE